MKRRDSSQCGDGGPPSAVPVAARRPAPDPVGIDAQINPKRFSPGTMPAGFTLAEVLVALAVIAVLAAVSVPVGHFALNRARSTACLAKLRGIGAAIEAHLQDHNSLMPELDAGRKSRYEDLPVLDNTLDRYVESPDTFHCPADSEEFARSGSSYLWNSTQSGRHRLKLAFFGVEGDPHSIPLVTDKEAWHPGEHGINVLYADYHISNKLEFRARAGSR